MVSTAKLNAFEQLPLEIVEAIIASLDFHDSYNLRLVSRTAPTQSDQSLLVEALSNLRSNTMKGGLQSMILRVRCLEKERKIVRPNVFIDWNVVWRTAFQTFEVAVRALIASGLPVEELDIFSSINGCSLPCNTIASLISEVELSKIFLNLKFVSLSLTNTFPAQFQIDGYHPLLRPASVHIEDIKRFLKACPHPDKLHLHFYEADSSSITLMTESVFFSRIFRMGHRFDNFKEVRLDGITASETSLLAFFEQTVQLTSVTLKFFLLIRGIYRPVFDLLTNPVAFGLPTPRLRLRKRFDMLHGIGKIIQTENILGGFSQKIPLMWS